MIGSFRCEKCGAVFREKDIVWKRIFWGNEIEPPEDVMLCPECGADGYEYFEEYTEDNEDGV